MSVLLVSIYLTSSPHGECWVNIYKINKCISKIRQPLVEVPVWAW